MKRFILLLLGLVLHSGLPAAATAAPGELLLRAQSRDAESGAVQFKDLHLNPKRTAVVVVDMWDRHWCKTYTARVANLVPRMNTTLDAARKLGLQVVFAPSDVVNFYKEYPQRKAMLAIPAHPEPHRLPFTPPELFKGDHCECGPNQPCQNHAVWSRQNADLVIAPTDLITDANDARELLSLCTERGIDTLLYLGVASNMCVCQRSVGMFNLRAHGFRTIFVADLVEAITANGFNPQKNAPDPDFTPAKGSALVQAFLEQKVAPSIESRQLLALAGLSPGGADSRPHIVFVTSDPEYQSGSTLHEFARTRLEPGFHCTFLSANPTNRNDIPGLSALYDADLLVLSVRRCFLPVPQMDHLERFIRSGKPLLALRVSGAAFSEGAGLQRQGDGRVLWQHFDQEVLGCHYNFYDPAARKTGSDVWAVPSGARHPVMLGLADLKLHTASWIYRVNPLAPGTTVLLQGKWSEMLPSEPVAWTRIHDGKRVFYTSLGHPDDFKLEAFQKLLVNAVNWALHFPQ